MSDMGTARPLDEAQAAAAGNRDTEWDVDSTVPAVREARRAARALAAQAVQQAGGDDATVRAIAENLDFDADPLEVPPYEPDPEIAKRAAAAADAVEISDVEILDAGADEVELVFVDDPDEEVFVDDDADEDEPLDWNTVASAVLVGQFDGDLSAFERYAILFVLLFTDGQPGVVVGRQACEAVVSVTGKSIGRVRAALDKGAEYTPFLAPVDGREIGWITQLEVR